MKLTNPKYSIGDYVLYQLATSDGLFKVVGCVTEIETTTNTEGTATKYVTDGPGLPVRESAILCKVEKSRKLSAALGGRRTRSTTTETTTPNVESAAIRTTPDAIPATA